MLDVPPAPRSLRWGWLVSGAAVFGWLGLEDNAVTSVVALGTAIAIYAAVMQLWRRIGGKVLPLRYAFVGAALFGAGVGSLSVVSIVTLMFLKTALHSHIFPDYPPLQMLAMLERLPAWAAAGALIAFGIMLVVQKINRTTRAVNAPPPAP